MQKGTKLCTIFSYRLYEIKTTHPHYPAFVQNLKTFSRSYMVSSELSKDGLTICSLLANQNKELFATNSNWYSIKIGIPNNPVWYNNLKPCIFYIWIFLKTCIYISFILKSVNIHSNQTCSNFKLRFLFEKLPYLTIGKG